jgi:hypothetical protein
VGKHGNILKKNFNHALFNGSYKKAGIAEKRSDFRFERAAGKNIFGPARGGQRLKI